jgi:predicted transposase YbfD/YdcC
VDHTGHDLAQRQVADKSNEIPAFRPLLDSVDLTGTVFTADALYTQHAHGTYLRKRGAHYIAQVKANHPFGRVHRLPWREITLDHYDRTRAHNRLEIRRLKTAAFAHLDYPDARQALQVVCWSKDFTSGKPTIERVYLITSLPPRGYQRPARRLDQRALEDRKPAAPRPRPHVPRGRLRNPVGISRASWPACATSPSASSVRTATPTSPPPYVTPPATGKGPWPPSTSPDESGQTSIMQGTLTGAASTLVGDG